MTQRAAIYARVSTAQQEHERTVMSQVAALEEAAQAMGLVVASTHRYIDDGVSGSRLDRPGLDALRDAAADGLIDLVLVYAPDRLAREVCPSACLDRGAGAAGCAGAFRRAPDRGPRRGSVARADARSDRGYERAKIVERTRRGKQHKLRMGQLLPYSTMAPYGYAIVRGSDGRRMVVIDEAEAVHVRAMYAWVLDEGLSARGVAKRLNREGVPPRRATLWTQGTIFHILTNPAYVGRATYNRRISSQPQRPRHPGTYRQHVKSSSRWRPQAEWLSVPIPAMVAPAMQEAVRVALRKHKRWSPRNVRHEYLLRGLVVCGELWLADGGAHQSRRTSPHEYFYYGCRHHDPVETGRTARCTARRVRRDEFDGVVWEAVRSWNQTPQMLEQEVAAWRVSDVGAAHIALIARAWRVSSVRSPGRSSGCSTRYQQGALSVEELRGRRERLEEARTAAHARAEELATEDLDRTLSIASPMISPPSRRPCVRGSRNWTSPVASA